MAATEVDSRARRSGRVAVTFIRPYEEEIRRLVVGAIVRAGATPTQVFRPPLAHGDIERYLRSTGRDDRLVVPFYKSPEDSGVDIVRRYHAAAGIERRILMPTKHALPSAVDAALASAIGGASERVLVVPIAQLAESVERIRAHFEAQQRSDASTRSV